jgi:hypothetical protein
MSRLATVDCHATRSNYLRLSENALGEIVKEYKGDRYLWRDNTHCAGSTISREMLRMIRICRCKNGSQ